MANIFMLDFWQFLCSALPVFKVLIFFFFLAHTELRLRNSYIRRFNLSFSFS